jgi:hypothetical protein
MGLRPSLTAALLAVSDEVAELAERGERVVSVETPFGSRRPRFAHAEVFLATDSAHEHGVSIFGWTDSDEEGDRA